MNLAEAREAVAAALNTLDDLNIRERTAVKTPRLGDGWVTLGALRPTTFRACMVTLTVVIILGADVGAAEELFEEYALDLVDAVTTADELNVADVVLEPITLVTEGGGTLHALTLTLTTEVEE